MTKTVKCLGCKKYFEAPIKELNRGNAKYCSRSCGRSFRFTSKTVEAGRTQARRLYISRHGNPLCLVCNLPADVHHKDGNTNNNEDSNHAPLCRSHHVALENHLFPKRKTSSLKSKQEWARRGGSTRQIHQEVLAALSQ